MKGLKISAVNRFGLGAIGGRKASTSSASVFWISGAASVAGVNTGTAARRSRKDAPLCDNRRTHVRPTWRQ
jgi:hypothetical protein